MISPDLNDPFPPLPPQPLPSPPACQQCSRPFPGQRPWSTSTHLMWTSLSSVLPSLSQPEAMVQLYPSISAQQRLSLTWPEAVVNILPFDVDRKFETWKLYIHIYIHIYLYIHIYIYTYIYTNIYIY